MLDGITTSERAARVYATIPSNRASVITQAITTAGIIHSQGGDWRQILREGKNTHHGKIGKVFKLLYEMDELEFDILLTRLG